MYKFKVKPAKTEGNIKANVTVESGILALNMTLVEKDGVLYLNNPVKWVEGFEKPFSQGYIQSDMHNKIRDEVVAEYEKAGVSLFLKFMISKKPFNQGFFCR
jgi:DNA-binding cell septation regulator SpoVG